MSNCPPKDSMWRCLKSTNYLCGEEKGPKTISVKTSDMWVKPPWSFSPYQPPYEECQVTLVNAMWSRRITQPTTPQIPGPQNYEIWLSVVVLRQEVLGWYVVQQYITKTPHSHFIVLHRCCISLLQIKSKTLYQQKDYNPLYRSGLEPNTQCLQRIKH